MILINIIAIMLTACNSNSGTTGIIAIPININPGGGILPYGMAPTFVANGFEANLPSNTYLFGILNGLKNKELLFSICIYGIGTQNTAGRG